MPPASAGSGKDGGESARPNPVALEALVTVTGAQPSGSDGSRNLFCEQTATVLVFKDGAVIRLKAPVSEGQLLFLTHAKSKEEIVCQVLHKRSFQAAVCFIELQFTEDRPDFWGVAFPEGKRGVGEFSLAEQTRAGATTEGGRDSVLGPQIAETADHLQKEVEALREQLFARGKKKTAESGKAAEPPTAMVANANPQAAPVSDLNRDTAKGMTEVLAPLMPEAADKKESERTVVGMVLPNPKKKIDETGEEASGTSEELLPDRAVPTSRMAAWVEPLRGRDSEEISKAEPKSRGKARSVGLFMILVLVLAGGAWYGSWWQYLPIGKKSMEVVTARAAKPNGPPAAQSPKGKVADTTAPAGRSSGTKKAGAAAADTRTDLGNNVGPGNGAEGKQGGERIAETSSAESPAGGTNEKQMVTKERVTGKTESKQKNVVNKASESSSSEKGASDAPLIPPKLLRTVNPVYPPEAMRKYITGDVKAELVVQPSGRVSEVRVIVGPQALRDAAVEALKQYEFAPATQGGKAVASKTTEVVKFWFNP